MLLERFHDEFVADLKAEVGASHPLFEAARRVLWMVCMKQFRYDYAVTTQADRQNVARTDLDALLRKILPEEYFEAQDRERKDYWKARNGKGKH